MSFRLRVLALLALVAVTAAGATAYLAFGEASRQVTETAAADRQTTDRIIAELDQYARHHGTWEGVPAVIAYRAAVTGQRIHLVTEDGVVVADTDTIEGRTARPVEDLFSFVDPRPVLDLPGPTDSARRASVAEDAVVKAIARYRAGVVFAACMTRHHLPVRVEPGAQGIPDYSVPLIGTFGSEGDVRECEAAREGTRPRAEAATAARRCLDRDLTPSELPLLVAHMSPANVAMPPNRKLLVNYCLQLIFADQTNDFAPAPLRVYLGAKNDPTPPLAPGPVAAAAALVALLAVAGTALLSRRVLRPIDTLTAASRQLGEGDLRLRVPVVGKDELAQLARSFNRMADSLQRGEERQRRLVADVAHELRTPLANLRGYLEALKDGVVPPTPELLASLHEEALFQQRIVDDLQDLALAEAGALTYHRAPTDLADLLETCRVAQQSAADAAQVTLRVEIEDSAMVRVDADRLRQVIGNLVSNALRATPPGGTITLRAAGSTIVVRDTGEGIAAENLANIFDRFWRADTARGRTTGGSGLGLAIARQIITDHDGQITADSEPGVGSAFTITLPAPAQILPGF